MIEIEWIVGNLITVWWLPALFWIAGGIACLLLRRSRWGPPVWTIVAAPALAFQLLVAWGFLGSLIVSMQAWPPWSIVYIIVTAPLSLLASLVLLLCPPPSTWRTPAALLCIPALLVAMAMSVGVAYALRDAHLPPATAKLVVPNGFAGQIWIRQDSDHGTPPDEIDGVTYYVIPASARLTTTKIRPLWDARRVVAEFADGEEIPDGKHKQQDEFGLWHPGGYRGVSFFFVGTRAQLQALRGRSHDLPPEWQEQADDPDWRDKLLESY